MNVDPGRTAGAWVAEQGRRETRRVWILLGLFAASMLAGTVSAQLGWLSSRHGAIAGASLVTLALIAFRAAERHSVAAVAWLRGSRAERAVGARLDRLREDGYLVLHDVVLDRGGNVDHVVCGRNGVYAVETKARRYEERHLRQARREAHALHERLNVWVTPVICLASREDAPYRREGVWVMGLPHLEQWLRDHRGRALDPDQALAALAQGFARETRPKEDVPASPARPASP